MDFKVMTAQELGQITGMIEKLSDEMRDIIRKADNPLQEKWLDNQDACTLLKLSTRTLQNYRDSGILQFSTLGGKIFYRAADIECVLNENHSSK